MFSHMPTKIFLEAERYGSAACSKWVWGVAWNRMSELWNEFDVSWFTVKIHQIFFFDPYMSLLIFTKNMQNKKLKINLKTLQDPTSHVPSYFTVWGLGCQLWGNIAILGRQLPQFISWVLQKEKLVSQTSNQSLQRC